jgi:hypothetical protein
MANTVEQVVETHLKVIDQASGPLGKIAHQAEKTEGLFGKIAGTLSGMAGVGAVVGAALSLHSAIESTEQYMENIKQITELTGAAVGQTDFLLSSARKAGVQYETMQRTMFQLSRRGAMLESTMAAAGNKVPGMAKKFEALGVNLQKGPVSSLIAMSDAVKKGKIGAGELMAQFRIPQKQANDMAEFLRGLDKAKLKAAGKKGSGFLDEGTLEAFKAIEKAQHRIADAWNRIKVTVISKLYPAVAKIAEAFADKLEAALPKIESAMQFVADHMDQIVAGAKILVAVMTAKKFMDVLSKMTSPSGIIGKMASGGISGAVGGGGGGIGAAFTQLNSIFATFVAALPVLIAIGAAIAVVYLGFRAFEKNIRGIGDSIRKHIESITARFEDLWDTLGEIGAGIASLFGGEGGGLMDVIGYIAALTFDGVLEALDFFVHILQTIAGMTEDLGAMFMWLWKDVLHDTWVEYVQEPFLKFMSDFKYAVSEYIDFLSEKIQAVAKFFGIGDPNHWGGGGGAAVAGVKAVLATTRDMMQAPMGMFMKNWNNSQRLTERQMKRDHDADTEAKKKKGGEDTKPPGTQMNFPNAKFDITQHFAEGFDPDRIAVAFGNDLASLGEMKSQSGFANVYAAR